jgi:hypothetical protein
LPLVHGSLPGDFCVQFGSLQQSAPIPLLLLIWKIHLHCDWWRAIGRNRNFRANFKSCIHSYGLVQQCDAKAGDLFPASTLKLSNEVLWLPWPMQYRAKCCNLIRSDDGFTACKEPGLTQRLFLSIQHFPCYFRKKFPCYFTGHQHHITPGFTSKGST